MVMTTTIPIPAIAAAPEVIQAGAPDGLLEAVPLLMGFEPADSLVVLGCQPPRVTVALRYDIDLQGHPADDIAAHAVGVLASQDMGILVAVGYGRRTRSTRSSPRSSSRPPGPASP